MFIGTGKQIKLVWRKERISSAVWLASLTLITVAVAVAFEGLLDGTEKGSLLAMFNSPATKAMLGPLYGDGLGAVFAGSMLLFTAIAVAIMNVFLVVKNTRGDEEKGRIEVIRSLPVGRLSNLSAVMIFAVAVNVALSLLISLSLTVKFEVGGCFLYGFTLGAIGLFFAVVAALFAQISPSSSGATGFSIALLGVLYILRMVGDVSAEWLSKITPLGMILRTQCFAGNKIWPLPVLLLISFAIAATAFYLNCIRDLDCGLLREKRGNTKGSFLFKNAYGFAFRLLRGGIIAWAVSLLVLGIAYGSVMDQMPQFMADLGLELSAGDLFGLLYMVLAVVAAVPAAGSMLKLAAEEKAKRSENILSKAVSRQNLMTGFLVIALAESFIMLFAVMFGLWGASTAAGLTLNFGAEFVKMMLYLPAVWFMVGLASLLVGLLPEKAGTITYSYLGVTGFLLYLGGILNNKFTEYLSPFGYIPKITSGASLGAGAIISLTALVMIASVMITCGYIFYRRRDLI